MVILCSIYIHQPGTSISPSIEQPSYCPLPLRKVSTIEYKAQNQTFSSLQIPAITTTEFTRLPAPLTCLNGFHYTLNLNVACFL